MTLCTLLAAAAVGGAQADAPKLQFRERALELGRLVSTQPIERTIALINPGASPFRIGQIALTPPLRIVQMPREIAPGSEGEIVLRFDPQALRGPFEGSISLLANASDQPEATLRVSAQIVRPIEVLPRQMFFIAATRGTPSSAALEIVNNEAELIRLDTPSHSDERFTTKLETLEAGRRFRLTLAMKPDAPRGRQSEIITIGTSSATLPRIAIAANTLVRERVYTFPDAIDLGSIPIREATSNQDLLRRVAQTLMVYQMGGDDFRIDASSDIRGLHIRSEPGPKHDRHQLTLWLDRSLVKVGTIRGTLSIRTNDAEWPRLEVPITGEILPD